VKQTMLERVLAARDAKQAVALVTAVPGGEQLFVWGSDRGAGDDVGDELWECCQGALRDDRSQMVEIGGDKYFVQTFNPALQMVIVGAVHITQALAPMAQLAGYQVTVVDPRRAFASDMRFPDVAVDTDWPDDALERIGINHRSAVVTLTHDPKLDDPALTVALKADAFYIGSLGSKRTHAARLDRLREAGFTDAELQRIHGPLGLPLGAKSPAEIAISAIAQVTQVLRQRPALT
jgi:xanthine dehydrogenase accessory factor